MPHTEKIFDTATTNIILGSRPPDELSALEAESHRHRLAIQDGITSGKGTEVAYGRHVKNYEDWWVRDQGRRMSEEGSTWKEVPAHPITAAKAAIFLHYEATRPKKSTEGKDIVGSRVGHSSLSQCLSALEQWRFSHQHEEIYKRCPESHVKLRDDHRIKTIETGARAAEPDRMAESQELKANGVLNDTYNNQEQLVRVSMWMLSQGRTASQIHKNIRDRSMNLMTTCVATKISASFPDRNILRKYTHPMTSWSHPGSLPDTSSWKIREPVIHDIAEFCTTRLRWVHPGINIRKRFDSKLWEGVFTRMLFSAELIYDSARKLFATPFTQARIVEIIGKPKEKSGLTCRRVKISTENFVRLMGTSALWPNIEEASIAQSTVRLWVPESLLDDARHLPNPSPRTTTATVLTTPVAVPVHPMPVASTSRLPGPRHLGFIEINSDSEGSEVSDNDRQSVISITDSSDEYSVRDDHSVIYISD